jgi:hypothetical protein
MTCFAGCPLLTFIRSLPPVLLDTPPKQQRLLHRLVYRMVTSKPPLTHVVPVETLKFEMSFSSVSIPVPADNDAPVPFRFACVVGKEVTLDVMLPDRSVRRSFHRLARFFNIIHRAMDIQFSAFESELLGQGAWPTELQTYARDIQSLYVTAASSPRTSSIPF